MELLFTCLVLFLMCVTISISFINKTRCEQKKLDKPVEVDSDKFIETIDKSKNTQKVNKQKKEEKQEKLNAKEIVKCIIEIDEELYEIFDIDTGYLNDLTILDKKGNETDVVYYNRIRDLLYELLIILGDAYKKEGVESKWVKELLNQI